MQHGADEPSGAPRRGDGRRLHPSSGGPALNAPPVIVALIAMFALIQLLRGMAGEEAGYRLLLDFAFLPLRYCAPQGAEAAALPLPDGLWPAFAGPVTHMFLHDGWLHLLVNSLWLAAFGAPVARRLGAARFLGLSMLSAAGGALFYLAFHCGEPALLLGASGAVSGLMGAALRLIYAGGLPLTAGMRRDLSAVRPLTVAQCLLLPRPRTFILVWMGINLAFGLAGMGQEMAPIAWEAHTGGFIAGLLAFGLFDPRPSATA